MRWHNHTILFFNVLEFHQALCHPLTLNIGSLQAESNLPGGVQYPPICNLPRLGNMPQELARIKADLN